MQFLADQAGLALHSISATFQFYLKNGLYQELKLFNRSAPLEFLVDAPDLLSCDFPGHPRVY